MDPRLGTDTSGPGEAVFAIRFNGKPKFSLEKVKDKNPDKNKIRSHVNSRCFFLSLFFWMFGHNSLPHHANLTKMGGNFSLSLPELSKPKFERSNRRKPKKLEVTRGYPGPRSLTTISM